MAARQYEFRKTGRGAWELGLPGRPTLAYGPATRAAKTLDQEARLARHVLGYARRRAPKIEDLKTSWSWHITSAGRIVALGACYASARGARRGYERARAAARGARIVTAKGA